MYGECCMKNTLPLLLASSALLLASCNGTNVNVPSTLTNVSGTLKEPTFNESTLTFGTKAWEGGAGSLIADGDDGKEVTRTTLAADGSFNLALPQTLAADRLSSLDVAELNSAEGCTGNFTSSGQANGALLELRVDANKDGIVAPASLNVVKNNKGEPTGISVTAGVLVYVDRAVTIKGSQTCTVEGESVTLNVDWRLGQGWNKTSTTLTIDLVGDVTSGSINFSSDSFPADWLYLEGSAAATPLSVGGLETALKAAQLKATHLPFFR